MFIDSVFFFSNEFINYEPTTVSKEELSILINYWDNVFSKRFGSYNISTINP